jgi:methionine-rich copper-binding protein CopC
MAIGVIPFVAAWGHAELVKSLPAAGATVTTSPSVIRAWFNDELAVTGSYIELLNAQQKQLAKGGVDPSAAKHDVMKLTPPRLAAGTYTVHWFAVSADDGATRAGSFKFTVKAAGV